MKMIALAVLSGLVLLVTFRILHYGPAQSLSKKQLQMLKRIHFPDGVTVTYSTETQCFNEPCNPSGTRAFLKNQNQIQAFANVSQSIETQGYKKSSGPPCNGGSAKNDYGEYCQSYILESGVEGCRNLGLASVSLVPGDGLVLYCFS